MTNIWATKQTVAYLREGTVKGRTVYVGDLAGAALALRPDPATKGADPAYRLNVEGGNFAAMDRVRSALCRATGRAPKKLRQRPASIRLVTVYQKHSGAGAMYFAGRLNGMRIVVLSDGEDLWRVFLQPEGDAAAERVRAALASLDRAPEAKPKPDPIQCPVWLQ